MLLLLCMLQPNNGCISETAGNVKADQVVLFGVGRGIRGSFNLHLFFPLQLDSIQVVFRVYIPLS